VEEKGPAFKKSSQKQMQIVVCYAIIKLRKNHVLEAFMEKLQALCRALNQTCPSLELRTDEPLARYTSFRIGGPAAVLALPATEAELRALLTAAHEHGVRPVILGAGSNVLVPDDGLPTLVIRTREKLNGIRLLDNGHIEADCGATLARVATFALEQGLTGLEFAHGIPGTVGGGILMNAGAYGGELCQTAVRTTVLELDGTTTVYEGTQQGFGYRHSAFTDLTGVILQTEFALTPGDPETIRATMATLAEKRRASQPLDYPSAGSTFKRPATGYAAALIDQAGLKGLQVGGAAVSEKHAGFVINVGGATCRDVLALMAQVQQRVEDASGVRLEPEVRILGKEDPLCNS
jgi:UDP-N-acetylmuramate dehydrogenase